jgi:hypothetical protein
MSVVLGFSFPDEAILISDSRISFIRGEVVIDSQDTLRKIFILTPQLAIGFTSGDVKMTHKIIAKMEEYIAKESKVKIVYHLLQKLPKVAEYEYKKLTKDMKKPPAMEFMYAGILSDRAFNVPEQMIMDIIKEGGGGALPESIGRAFMSMRNGVMTIPPPTPVIMKHFLPSGKKLGLGVYTQGAIGSGAQLQELFGKEYARLFTSGTSDGGTFRGNFIRIMCDDFIKQVGIKTVGGAVQVIRISATGAIGVNSSFKRIFSDSSVQDISTMEFDGEKWTFTDHEKGKKPQEIRTYLPPKKQ